MTPPPVIALSSKAALLGAHWSPRIVARMNNYDFKVVTVQGTFIWHRHAETDEAFIVLEGTMQIEFRDGIAELSTGDMIVVPKGIEHRPRADAKCSVLVIEPRGTLNTGDAGGPLTATDEAWI